MRVLHKCPVLFVAASATSAHILSVQSCSICNQKIHHHGAPCFSGRRGPDHVLYGLGYLLAGAQFSGRPCRCMGSLGRRGGAMSSCACRVGLVQQQLAAHKAISTITLPSNCGWSCCTACVMPERVVELPIDTSRQQAMFPGSCDNISYQLGTNLLLLLLLLPLPASRLPRH